MATHQLWSIGVACALYGCQGHPRIREEPARRAGAVTPGKDAPPAAAAASGGGGASDASGEWLSEAKTQLEDKFVADALPDAPAKTKTETAVRDVFLEGEVVSAGVELADVSCKKTMCRVEVVAPTDMAIETAVRVVFMTSPKALRHGFTIPGRKAHPKGRAATIFIGLPE